MNTARHRSRRVGASRHRNQIKTYCLHLGATGSPPFLCSDEFSRAVHETQFLEVPCNRRVTAGPELKPEIQQAGLAALPHKRNISPHYIRC